MSKQFTIIDGYNLLHVTGILDSQRVGPGTLEKARNNLVGIVSNAFGPNDRRRTTIVFDSSEPNLPNRTTANDILIEFANEFESADEQIKLLIARHSAPKQLLVVSSDHEIQKAAIARGATSVDSDIWLDQIQDAVEKPASTDSVGDRDLAKPDSSSSDAKYWKDVFAMDEVEPESVQRWGKRQVKATENESQSDSSSRPKSTSKPDDVSADSDLFPPGYADDLFE